MTAGGALERGVVASGGVAVAAAAFQLLLLLAAAGGHAARRRAPRPGDPAAPRTRFVVLVPAHDEAAGIAATLEALARLAYPRELVRVVVVADNCEDATADVARAGGAEVLERRSPQRGKGHALAWALPRLGGDDTGHDAVVFVDADCEASANLLTAIHRRMRAGAEAVQADYVVGNPAESWAAALRYAGFALMNTVRPQGREALGLSCGILGSGFAVRREVLDRDGWQATSLTEDTEFHSQLVAAGIRVRFADEARVSSAMPATLRGAEAQQARWESGKLEMWRRWLPNLIVPGGQARVRGRRHLLGAAEGALPPQSILAAWGLATVAAGAALRSGPALRLGSACLAGQAAYVLGGLRLARAPRTVYRALAFAPLLVGWKLWLYVRLVAGGSPREWQRTQRAPG